MCADRSWARCVGTLCIHVSTIITYIMWHQYYNLIYVGLCVLYYVLIWYTYVAQWCKRTNLLLPLRATAVAWGLMFLYSCIVSTVASCSGVMLAFTTLPTNIAFFLLPKKPSSCCRLASYPAQAPLLGWQLLELALLELPLLLALLDDDLALQKCSNRACSMLSPNSDQSQAKGSLLLARRAPLSASLALCLLCV